MKQYTPKWLSIELGDRVQIPNNDTGTVESIAYRLRKGQEADDDRIRVYVDDPPGRTNHVTTTVLRRNLRLVATKAEVDKAMARKNPPKRNWKLRDGGYDKTALEVFQSQPKIRRGTGPLNNFERSYLEMVKGWLSYADAHRNRYGAVIGEDYAIGPMWLEIGRNLKELLNGDIGTLSAGAFDNAIRKTVVSQGFSENEAEEL